MASLSSFVSTEFVIYARELAGVWWPLIQDGFFRLYDISESSDATRNFNKIISTLKTSISIGRLLSPPLNYVRNHCSQLRHANIHQPCFKKEVIIKVINSMENVIVCLHMMHKYEHIQTNEVVELIYNYYLAYHDYIENIIKCDPNSFKDQIRSFNKILHSDELYLLPLLQETSLASSSKDSCPIPVTADFFIPPPPQGKTIKWYKNNNYSEFMLKCKIIPLSGDWVGCTCVITRYNGTNTKICRLADGKFKYLHGEIPVSWE